MRDDVLISLLRRRIREIRLARNLTQEDMAERTDLPLRSYQRYEAKSEKRPFSPSLLSVLGVARALEVELADLVKDPTLEEIEGLEVEAVPRRAKRSRR